jgi:hypothetical protein
VRCDAIVRDLRNGIETGSIIPFALSFNESRQLRGYNASGKIGIEPDPFDIISVVETTP